MSNKKKVAKKGEKTADDDEDWEAILAAEQAANAANAPPPVPEPVVKQVDADDEEDDDDDEADGAAGAKKDKKKKRKKKGGKKDSATAAPAALISAAARANLQAQEEEEARIKKLQDAEDERSRLEEERIAAEEKAAAEEKERRRKAKLEKKEAQVAADLIKAEKEKQKKIQARLDALKAAGVTLPTVDSTTPAAPVKASDLYKNAKATNNKRKVEEVKSEPVVAATPELVVATAPEVADDWDDDSDSESNVDAEDERLRLEEERIVAEEKAAAEKKKRRRKAKLEKKEAQVAADLTKADTMDKIPEPLRTKLVQAGYDCVEKLPPVPIEPNRSAWRQLRRDCRNLTGPDLNIIATVKEATNTPIIGAQKAKQFQVRAIIKHCCLYVGYRKLVYYHAEVHGALCNQSIERSIYYSDNGKDLHIVVNFESRSDAMRFIGELLSMRSRHQGLPEDFQIQRNLVEIVAFPPYENIFSADYIPSNVSPSASTVSVTQYHGETDKRLQCIEDIQKIDHNLLNRCHIAAQAQNGDLKRLRGNTFYASRDFHAYYDGDSKELPPGHDPWAWGDPPKLWIQLVSVDNTDVVQLGRRTFTRINVAIRFHVNAERKVSDYIITRMKEGSRVESEYGLPVVFTHYYSPSVQNIYNFFKQRNLWLQRRWRVDDDMRTLRAPEEPEEEDDDED